eukprot:SAG31_NODE_9147_length_1326_cov_1.193969_1_plen_388_part_10
MLLAAGMSVAARPEAAGARLKCSWNVKTCSSMTSNEPCATGQTFGPLKLSSVFKERMDTDFILLNGNDGIDPGAESRLPWGGSCVPAGILTFGNAARAWALHNRSMGLGWNWQASAAEWRCNHTEALRRDVPAKVPATWTGIVSHDYEDGGPSWSLASQNCSRGWRMLVSALNSPKIDPDFAAFSGIAFAPSVLAVGWPGMNASQRATLLRSSYDAFEQMMWTTTLKTCRELVPKARWGNWGYPPLVPYSPSSSLPLSDWYVLMMELSWLWKELDVFLPALYPRFYVGDANHRPPMLKRECGQENNTALQAYFSSTIVGHRFLRERIGRDEIALPIIPVVWYHYMCDQHCRHGSQPNFADMANIEGSITLPFQNGADGIVLWGSSRPA